MGSNAAIRQRRHRARLKQGRIALLIEADEVSLTEQLVIAGFLRAEQMDDREAIRAALQRVVDLWSQGAVTRNDTAF